nr:hypothetical protein [Tanacetum cinerariifolium]
LLLDFSSSANLHGSGISFLQQGELSSLAVGTSSGSGNFITGSGNALCILFPTVSLAGNAQNAPPTLKDPKFWTAKEKKTQNIDRLARSLLIQGLPNDIYSLIDSNETAKDL